MNASKLSVAEDHYPGSEPHGTDPMNLINDLHHKVYVATAVQAQKRVGFVVTWVTPASLNAKEPRILMVVSKFNHSLATLRETKKCILNLLSEDQVREFFIFGSRHSDEVDKFSGIRTEQNQYGLRLLDAVGSAEVEIETMFETPDRWIFYGKVQGDSMGPGTALTLGTALAALSSEEKSVLDIKMGADVSRDEKQFTPGPS
ncbi:MAG TPA: flavin reductase family protein [Bacteriovoracaceae bacterium]|nr:flavin reductase family protein [Bacteriovoracaceae bacterium]